MKLGFMLGYWMPDPFDPLEWALEAERLGYDSIWAGEAYGSDAITPLAWIGSHTKRLKLGTSVIQMSARTPACDRSSRRAVRPSRPRASTASPGSRRAWSASAAASTRRTG